MVKFNSITLVTGITIDTWDNRPGTGDDSLTAADGDYFQVTGSALYRYSDDIGEWVRPFAYEGTPVLDIKLRGSVLPAAESPAWHPSGSGTNVTSTDGEYVTMSESGWAHNSIAYTHSQTQKKHFFQGYMQQTSADGANIGLVIKDGVKLAWIQLGNRTDSQRLIMKNLGQSGNSAEEERIYINDFTNEPKYLEVYFAASGSAKGCMVFIDHEPFASVACDYEKLIDHEEAADSLYNAGYGQTNTSGSLYFFGSTRANKTGITYKLKECFWGRY
tara:strand:- start:1112 stop:1933 length:822 start_codon:yes stop_codon:yes gene_type:complete